MVVLWCVVHLSFSCGLYNGRRLAAVVVMQFAMWTWYSTSRSAGSQNGVEWRQAVLQHRPEGHLLRHWVQVRPSARPRPDARYSADSAAAIMRSTDNSDKTIAVHVVLAIVRRPQFSVSIQHWWQQWRQSTFIFWGEQWRGRRLWVSREAGAPTGRGLGRMRPLQFEVRAAPNFWNFRPTCKSVHFGVFCVVCVGWHVRIKFWRREKRLSPQYFIGGRLSLPGIGATGWWRWKCGTEQRSGEVASLCHPPFIWLPPIIRRTCGPPSFKLSQNCNYPTEMASYRGLDYVLISRIFRETRVIVGISIFQFSWFDWNRRKKRKSFSPFSKINFLEFHHTPVAQK